MARIRTIKPEFPQSESMGRISRDARLLFVQLWTICDDSGKARAASRMLASLLFPYDDDAPDLIDGWIAELEQEGCVVRYMAEGSTYLQVCNWLNHQKIDKPSASKIPEFSESSRIVAKPREDSRLLLGKEGKGIEKEREKTSAELTTLASHDDDPEPDSATPRRSAVELKTWIESLGDDDAIPADDPIFTYAEKAGIRRDWLELSWLSFCNDMAEKRTKKRDWRAHYRNAVRGNWYRIWWFKDGQSGLTTVGEQARRVAA